MRIVQIMPRAFSKASGPTATISELTRVLVDRGVDVEVHGVTRPEQPDNIQIPGRFVGYPCRRVLPGVESSHFSCKLVRELPEAVRRSDILHNNGLWAAITVTAALSAIDAKRPQLWSPRGTLGDWARDHKRFRKSLSWYFVQKRLLERVDCIHVTSRSEYEDVRKADIKRPVALIPHGVKVPSEETLPDAAEEAERRIVYLGRIHEVKGLDRLVKAWARVYSDFKDWSLRIVGPGKQKELSRLQKLTEDLRVERLTFAGPVYGSAKSKELVGADLFVLPSHGENFALAVAEALAHGVPVIVSRHTPWEEVETHKCGWWVNPAADTLAETLIQAMSRSQSHLQEMGRRGRSWMSRDFSWPVIGHRIHETYTWMCGASSRPAWVLTT